MVVSSCCCSSHVLAVLPSAHVDKVVGWAVSNHLMTAGADGGLSGEGDEQRIAISPQSIDFALKLLEESKPPERVCIRLFCFVLAYFFIEVHSRSGNGQRL